MGEKKNMGVGMLTCHAYVVMRQQARIPGGDETWVAEELLYTPFLAESQDEAVEKAKKQVADELADWDVRWEKVIDYGDRDWVTHILWRVMGDTLVAAAQAVLVGWNPIIAMQDDGSVNDG